MGTNIAEVLRYKGYSSRPEYSAEDRVFYGEISGISDLVNFQAKSVEGLKAEFCKAVDDYLAFCADIGKEPDPPNAPPV